VLTVEGRVRNASGSRVNGATLTITMMRNDSIIGTATDSVMDVGPGDTRTIRAMGTSCPGDGQFQWSLQTDVAY
jgi:hypothetical protein